MLFFGPPWLPTPIMATRTRSLGGSAACVNAQASVPGSVALCTWADNDTFGVVASPTMTAARLVVTAETPGWARAAGFEQIPFGRFEGPFLGGDNRPTEVFRKLWAEEAAPLTFRFGYPDRAGHDHLLITRRATEK